MEHAKLKLVADWWRVRCVEGSQFRDPAEFIEGWDYFGAGPWYPWVALQALRAEFYMTHGHKMNMGDFSAAFNTVGTFLARRGRRVTLKRENGISFVHVRRSFYVFGDKPILDPHLPVGSNASVSQSTPTTGVENV